MYLKFERYLSAVSLIGIYSLSSYYFNITFLPTFPEILQELFKIIKSGLFEKHMSITLLMVLLSLTISSVIALVLGINIGLNKRFSNLIDLPLTILMTVPGFIWALLSLIWFGIGNVTTIVATCLTISPVLIVTISQEVKNIDQKINEVARVYNISKVDQLLYIVIPQLSYQVLSVLRTGFAMAWKFVLVAEVFGVSSGVGYQINMAYHTFNSKQIFAWVISFSIIALLFDKFIFAKIEKLLTNWKEEISSSK